MITVLQLQQQVMFTFRRWSSKEGSGTSSSSSSSSCSSRTGQRTPAQNTQIALTLLPTPQLLLHSSLHHSCSYTPPYTTVAPTLLPTPQLLLHCPDQSYSTAYTTRK
ncbi:hypothetical protein FHG87_001959 [Trinorchestia longiramus]|nr:hypothetical protein FHG87_001959 [Trinorchestia longiramus]